MERVGSIASTAGCRDALEHLLEELDVDAVVLRVIDGQEHEYWDAIDPRTSLSSHRNALRVMDLGLSLDGPGPARLDPRSAGSRWTGRLQGWGVRSVLATDTEPLIRPRVRLEIFSAHETPLDRDASLSLRVIVRELAAVVAARRFVEQRRESASFVRRLTNSGPTLVHHYIPRRGETLFVNGRCQDFLAAEGLRPRDELPVEHNRHPWLRRVLPRDESRLAQQLLRTEDLGDGEILEGIYRFEDEVGERRLRIWTTRIPAGVTGADDEVLLTALDVTQQWHLERHLEQLELRKQRQFGSEVHDGICQDLIGLKIALANLHRDHEEVDPRRAEELERISAALGACLRRARAIAHGVRPVDLDRDGFGPAVHGLLERTQSRFGVRCRAFERGAGHGIEPEDAQQIFWIVQEAVLNAARHSEAEEILVHLRFDDDCLRVRVMDDGKGFDPRNPPGGGMGLQIIEHRAHLIGAHVAVESSPGAGTTVYCEHELDGRKSHD